MRWAVDRAGPATLTVATETCAPSAERLYARFCLEEAFAELVMRHPLDDVPTVPAPDGVTVTPVADASPHDLFAAYVGSFADRPGFPDPRPAAQAGGAVEQVGRFAAAGRDMGFSPTAGGNVIGLIRRPWLAPPRGRAC